jgi:hypothetical protein
MPSKNPRNTKTQTTAPTATAPTETTALVDKEKRSRKPLGPKNALYSAVWMVKWLTAAADATSAIDVCEECERTMAEYLEGRLDDSEFDSSCRIFDQIVELRIIDKVRGEAAKGDIRAQALYFKAVRRPAFAPAFISWSALPPPPPANTPLPAAVADAMVEAGLAAYERLQLPAPSPAKR